MVKIVVGNVYSKIVGFLPEEVSNELDATLSYKLLGARFIPSVKNKQWDGVIRLYYRHKGQSFFTGLLAIVRELFKKHNIAFELVDGRQRPAINYPELAFIAPKSYENRDYQDFTLDRAYKFTRGILSVCTGGGKTMLVTRLIAKIQTYPFIFYVLTKDLMEQAHEVLSKCLNQPIGKIGDGEVDIKKISVCTIQTAILALNMGNSKFKISDYSFDDEDEWDEKGIDNAEKAAKIRKLIGMAKGLYLDECVTGDTKIVTELGVVTIRDAVKNKCRFVQTHDGNNIVFKKIINWWKHDKRVIRKIKLQNGEEIKCTNNHLICTKRGWVRSKEITKKDYILCVNVVAAQKYPKAIDVVQENMFLDIKLKEEQDQNGKKYTNLILKACPNVFAVAAKKYYQDIKPLTISLGGKDAQLDTVNISKDTTNSQYGKTIIFNQQKGKFRQYSEHVLETRPSYCQILDPKIIDWQQIILRNKRNGQNTKQPFYRDILCDCDTLKIKDMVNDWLICNQNVCHVLRKLLDYYMIKKKKEYPTKYWTCLDILDWLGGFVMTEAKTKETGVCHCIFRDGIKKTAKSFVLGLIKKDLSAHCTKISDATNYFYTSKNNPLLNWQEKSGNMSHHVCNTKWQQVKSISIEEKERVYDIEVEDTHCFFANGILVHNCHHVGARTAKEVLIASPNAYWKFGGSATPQRESGDDIMIQAMFGSKIVDINASYLIKRNWLVRPYIFFEPIKTETKFHSYHKIYETCVVKNDNFNTHVADTAKHLISRGLSVLILVKQYPQGDFLKTLIPNSEFITGRISKMETRTDIIDKLRKREIMCMIATSLADEGLDIPSLDAVLIAGGGKSSTRLFQRIGRTLRKDKEGNKNKSIVIVYEHDSKYLYKHVQRVRTLLKREPEFIIKNSNGTNFICGEIDEVLGFKNKQDDLFT